ncbi:MAG: putative membrane-bound dehydrogenase-like protein [Limisphaerales bacterium]|jgi:putative membrane-bound dehydrogenase-like protein
MKFRISLFSAVASLLVLFAGTNQAAPKTLRALYVGGGCCHDYETQKILIAEGLEERAHIKVDVVVQGGSTTDTKIPLYENADWAKGYDVVIHHECFAAVKDLAFVERVLKPHREGLPAVVLHCAMHCYRTKTDDWFEFCGVTSHGHGKHYPHEVLKADGAHPIMKGFPLGWWNPAGELYHIAKFGPASHALATSKNQESGKDEVTVWTNLYREKTRVFGSTLGHHNETVGAPEFLDLLTRGTLWAAGRLDDESQLKPRKPKLIKADLAGGRSATASSVQSGNEIKNAFDGDSRTRWCASNSSYPQRLQVDLGEPKDVAGVSIQWEVSGAQYQYTVSASADGKEWRQVLDRRDNTRTGVFEDAFSAKAVRYVKIDALGSNGGWASIWEFKVLGTTLLELPTVNSAISEKEIELLKTVKVPEGYEATIFAAPPAVNYPTFVKAAENGVVFISSDKNGSLARDPFRGSILRAVDFDGDGRADQVNRFVPNLDSPRGLEWDGEWLYCLHPPHISRFRDTDGDGVADETQRIVSGIAFDFSGRPADHTSNGITLGIDGWLYCAIGDFGFLEAKGADGKALQFRGGGVVRVRPDGSNIHIYSRGTRNIYEVAVSPRLDAFARDNTNDGGGWDVRFHHFTGMENHGYPSLYRHFNEEIVQPLADYGGGSGTGALYLSEPGFPGRDGDSALTVDWGRGWIYRHEIEPNGATFKETAVHEFIGVPRPNDIDNDAQGRLYVASWKDGRFKYDGENIGFVAMVEPETSAFPRSCLNWSEERTSDLIDYLAEVAGAKNRLAIQRELLRRKLGDTEFHKLAAVARDIEGSVEGRIAAVFTLKLAFGERVNIELAGLTGDPQLAEYAYRAMGDEPSQSGGISDDVLKAGLSSGNPRTRTQAVHAIARLGRGSLAGELLRLTADPDDVIAHTAINALRELKAVKASLAVLSSGEAARFRDGALAALQGIHGKAAVDGLIASLKAADSKTRKAGIIKALARLYFEEGEWDGKSWGTRPDTTGPYYYRVEWEQTRRIGQILQAALKDDSVDRAALLGELERHQIELDGTLPLLTALASKDASLEPSLVNLLLRQKQIPDETVGLLIRIANDAKQAGDVRLRAGRALTKTTDLNAAQAVFDLVLKRNGLESIPHEKNWLKQDFERSRSNLKNYRWLIETAQNGGKAESAYAWETLRIVQKWAAPDSIEKQAIESAFIMAQADVSGIIRELNGLAESGNPRGVSYVEEALKSKNAAVLKAARMAAYALGMDAPPSKGPKIAGMKPEAVLDAIMKIKGDPKFGAMLFRRQICVNCHTTDPGEELKGPYLGNITSIYKRRDLGIAILQPNASLAQGFASVRIETKDGEEVAGFVTQEIATEVILRDITGNRHVIKKSDIAKREETKLSMMPEGLAGNLTVEDLASLIAYLESLNKAK